MPQLGTLKSCILQNNKLLHNPYYPRPLKNPLLLYQITELDWVQNLGFVRTLLRGSASSAAMCYLIRPRAHHDGIQGTGGLTPLILNQTLGHSMEVSFTTRPLHSQGKKPMCPFNARATGPQNRS